MSRNKVAHNGRNSSCPKVKPPSVFSAGVHAPIIYAPGIYCLIKKPRDARRTQPKRLIENLYDARSLFRAGRGSSPARSPLSRCDLCPRPACFMTPYSANRKMSLSVVSRPPRGRVFASVDARNAGMVDGFMAAWEKQLD